MIQRINHMISRIIRRVKTSLTMDDKGFTPTVQVNYQGGSASSEIWMPYGIAYSPPLNSLGFMFNTLGNMDDRVSYLYDPSTRFKGLKEGEFQIGNQLKKTFLKFEENGDIIISSEKDVNVFMKGQVNLGSGGNNIARLGDTVQVTITAGSSAGVYQGTIISAGNNTST